jgi:cytochrome b
MRWNMRIRQFHRWLSIIFTLAVLINIAAMTQGEPALWIGLLALFPLILLLASGLYLFALPYLARA